MIAPGPRPRMQAVVGLALLAAFAAASLWARFDPPYMDDWDWWLFTAIGPRGIEGLFHPHNEHVIPLARLLMQIQHRLPGLDGHLVQAVALACHLTMAAVCWREVGRRWPGHPEWRWTVGGLVLVCLGFAQQLQSMVFAASVLFPLVQLGATVAVVALLNATEPGTNARHRWWWGVGLGVGASALSTTSGLAVPFVLAVLAWWRGASRWVIGACGAAGLALAAAYLAWVGPGGATASGSPGPAVLAAYGLAVFGAGLSQVHAGMGVLAGAVVIGAVMAAGVLATRRPDRLTRLEVFALGLMAFGAASAIMVTPGRAQFGVALAGQSRYATFVMPVIAAVVMFGASRLERMRPAPGVTRGLAQAALVLSLLVVLPNLYMALLWRAKADVLNLAYLSVRSGVSDPAWMQTLHPRPEVVSRVVAVAEAAGHRVIDPRIGAAGPRPAPVTACGGAGRLNRGGAWDGWRLTGTWPSTLTHGVVLDQTGTVVGLAQRAPWVSEPDPSLAVLQDAVRRRLARLFQRRGATDWAGFARDGGGPPYRWVAGTVRGDWSCSDPLAVDLHPGAPGEPR